MFNRVLKMLLTDNVLIHLIRYYLLKVGTTTSGRGSYKYFFWLISLNINNKFALDFDYFFRKNIEFCLSLI